MNRFCGPYIVAHLLDETPDEAARRIRRHRSAKGRHCRSVRGVGTYELWEVLRCAGIRTGEPGSYTKNGRYPTLAAWLRYYRASREQRMFVLAISHHFILVKGRKIYDNHNPSGIFLRKYPHRRRRVRSFFFVGADF